MLAGFETRPPHSFDAVAEQLRQIITEYPRLRLGRHVELVEDLLLRVEHRLLPAAREERRIGAEQQPRRTDDIERAREDVAQRQAGVEPNPVVRR